jgi:hypothetical protein
MTNLATAISEDRNKPRLGILDPKRILIDRPRRLITDQEARREGKQNCFIPFPVAADYADIIEKAEQFEVTREVALDALAYQNREADTFQQGMGVVHAPTTRDWFELPMSYLQEQYNLGGCTMMTPALPTNRVRIGCLIVCDDTNGRAGSAFFFRSALERKKLNVVSDYRVDFDFNNPNYAAEQQAHWPEHLKNGPLGHVFGYCKLLLTTRSKILIDAGEHVLAGEHRIDVENLLAIWKKVKESAINQKATEWSFFVAVLQMVTFRQAVDETLVAQDPPLNRARENRGAPPIRNYRKLTLKMHLAGRAPAGENQARVDGDPEQQLRHQQRRRRGPHTVIAHYRTIKNGDKVLVRAHRRCHGLVDDNLPAPIRILRR